jgi:hypothetical protein
MFPFEDKSKPVFFIEDVVEAAKKLKGMDLQRVCMTCALLISNVFKAGEDQIDANTGLNEIQVLKQFFNNDELNALLAWLGLAYDPSNNLLITLIKKHLVDKRIWEFVNKIQTKLPDETEKYQATDIRAGVSSSVKNLKLNPVVVVAEGSVTMSPFRNIKCLRLPDGSLYYLKRNTYLLRDCPVGTQVRFYSSVIGFSVSTVDN